MKILFVSFFIIAALAFSVHAATEPVMSAFDAKVLKKFENAQADSEKIKILTDALEDAQCGAIVYFNLANLKANAADFASAIELYKKALQLHKDFYLAARNLAICLLNTNSPDAFEMVKKALALSGGTDAQMLSEIARLHFNHEDYSASLAACNQALIFLPESKDVLLLKAANLYNLKNFNEAKNLAQNLLKNDEKFLPAWEYLFLSNLEISDYSSALSVYESAQLLGLDVQKFGINAADIYLKLKLYDKALALYKKALLAEKSSISPDKLLNIARLIYHENEFKHAEDFAIFLEKNLDAEHSLQALEIRLIAESLKDPQSKELETLAQEILQRDDSNPLANFELGKIKLQNSNAIEALTCFASAAKSQTYFYNAMLLKSRAYILLEDFKNAIDTLKTLNSSANSKEILDFIKKLQAFEEQKK